MAQTVYRTALRGLEKIHEGKVRDIYAVDAQSMLIVTTDRLSAFDVVLPDPIPDKGRVLNQISNFWFARTAAIVPNHLTGRDPGSVVKDPDEKDMLADRAVVVRRLSALPIEAVVRGYLIGSGWKDYQKTGAVCGIQLPAGLRDSDKLPQPIFTPASKAQTGHDENISFDDMVKRVGRELSEKLRDLSLKIYQKAADFALTKGIIIADTKFEFGMTAGGIVLADEVLTPDSSRFWPADKYQPGRAQDSFDKQYVRDYLEQIKWNKQPPAPALPSDVTARTTEKYVEAYRRLSGRELDA
jgi:phosphoribosylaminoimidazole-succinocarboxamide synthase